MATLKELKAKRDELLAHARKIADTATHAENQKAGNAVIAVQKAIIALIVEGAKPCPVVIVDKPAEGKEPAVTHVCGLMPVGMEQPAGKGRFEYEVGCRVCRTIEHTDGTIRKVSVRGGMLPKHAVDAWNAGPDHWTIVTDKPAAVTPAEPEEA